MVLWSAETAFADVARVALAPPPDLRSSFRPTYNLAVNLVRRFDRPTAVGLLRRSFAQWQANARDRQAGHHAPAGARPSATPWWTTWDAGWPSSRSWGTWTGGG